MKRHIFGIVFLTTLFFFPGIFGNASAQTLLFDSKTIQENWENNWNEREKGLWYAHIVLQLADTVTTIHALERKGVYEANSVVYGKHPSPERIVLTKAVVLWGSFSVLNDYTPKGSKETGLIVLDVLYSIIVANNMRIAYRF
ncbi:MAG: hypothetical protein A3D67_00745 [Candidatus Lloydbacteria bacterium RIFCSPHIGHO2_02_FULL_51_22]|uniref:DUF5658 domain-containing protein n=3 Tax=Candidatus Lloydiibacteriota TaxID=1817910 RepID=A0A1G2DHS4_9BACT|nr:MAG: hypothetical protein A3D67_00745 [Candidatus Lloydbacteria bacterium RIFCSPHIGHO2_02_FULL_51_22]OGZ15890.1 MAG: hypothetical protein A3J08_04615 [Candidatus Lloydbacteria bacterium RIFCSPLOWO2_02_FULL_51_11]OGZ16664.1 MAG: hypothetical protein A3G11_02970 [Candidatus Lloydbacteria bacterium RIFCSPLOWO2_12_FULL_51_9]